MADWRWLAYDLRTNAYLRDLEVSSWSSVDELSATGTFQASVTVPEDPLEAQSVRAATACGKTAIVVLRGDVPVYDGIIWRRLYDSGTRQVTLAGRKLASYWDHFDIPARTAFAAVDQLTIWRALLAGPATLFPGGDIGIVADATVSGVLRDRVYESWEGKYYGEAMAQLAEVIDGFDWDIRVENDGGVLTRQARTWYPRRGRTTSATGLQFRTGSNAKLFGTAEDATKLAARVAALGAGDGELALVQIAQSLELVVAGYPGYSKTLPLKDIKTADVLLGHARGELAVSSRVEADSFTIQVDPTFADQPWGSWDLGDDVTLVVEDDPWYPVQEDGSPGLAIERRIIAHNWVVRGAEETLRVGLTKRGI